jgi:hypothetical protein
MQILHSLFHFFQFFIRQMQLLLDLDPRYLGLRSKVARLARFAGLARDLGYGN